MIVVSGEVVRRGVGRGEERGKGRRGDEGSRITRESRACYDRGLVGDIKSPLPLAS